MYELSLTVFTRVGRLAALGILLTLPTVRAQSACTDQVTNLIKWLKTPPPGSVRYLDAIVASNHSGSGVVTYTSIPMTVGSGYGIDWLMPKDAGKQYFSNVKYGTFPLSHPFSPAGIKTNKIIVHTSGSVTVKPNNGSVTHTFTAKCEQGSLGVMHGFQPPGAFQLPLPYYTISWIKYQSPIGPS